MTSKRDQELIRICQNRYYIDEHGDLISKRTGRPVGARGAIKGLCVRIGKTRHPRARAVFAVSNGTWPVHYEHIDGDEMNDHPGNLRVAKFSMRERRRVYRTTRRDGSVGYYAVVSHNGIARGVGTYDTIDEAVEARDRVERLIKASETAGVDLDIDGAAAGVPAAFKILEKKE